MQDLASYLRSNNPTVRVELCEVRGSSPREAGTVMFVSGDSTHGTIGGGQMEYMAMDAARVLLKGGRKSDHMSVPLGPEIGQCCGGFVEISLVRMDESSIEKSIREDEVVRASYPTVVVFGSGHVGRALASILALMPVKTIVVDDRSEELALCQAPVTKRCIPIPEQEVRAAPPGSAFIIATNDHAEDFLIATEALARTDAAYVGMIGSKTKRATYESWYKKNVEDGPDTQALVCPIGAAGSDDKRPEIIAMFVAAEIVGRLTLTSAQATGDALLRSHHASI